MKTESLPETQPHAPAPPGRRLIPLTDWPRYHPWPSVAGLRHLRFHCETNGFGRAFKTAGRRVLVDEREFFACLDRQHGAA